MMAKGTYASINLATKDLDGTFERLQAGDGEVGVAPAAGQDDPGAEHVDEQQREQHRLDGDVGELQRLTRDVYVPPAIT